MAYSNDLLKPGHILAVINSTSLESMSFREVMETIRTALNPADPINDPTTVSICFVNPNVVPPDEFYRRYRLSAGHQQDKFGFIRNVDFLVEERRYLESNQDEHTLRDLEWHTWMKSLRSPEEIELYDFTVFSWSFFIYSYY